MISFISSVRETLSKVKGGARWVASESRGQKIIEIIPFIMLVNTSDTSLREEEGDRHL